MTAERAVVASVFRCPRCGAMHVDLELRAFRRPPVCDGITLTHFMFCPTTGEPILGALKEAS